MELGAWALGTVLLVLLILVGSWAWAWAWAEAWGLAHWAVEAWGRADVGAFLGGGRHAWLAGAHVGEVWDVLGGDAHVCELAGDFAGRVTALETCHVGVGVSHGGAAVLVAHGFLLLHLAPLLFLAHHLLFEKHRLHARIHAVVHKAGWWSTTALWLAWLLSGLIEEGHVRILWRLAA